MAKVTATAAKLITKISDMRQRPSKKRIVIWVYFLAAIMFSGVGAGPVHGQEASRTVEQTYQFDDRGDAKIEFNFQLGKAQWDAWKTRFGDHPDEMLRTINHDFAAAVIEDFALEKDDTHRHAIARFKARALAQYHGNDQFEIQVPKNMKLVTGSGLEWVFTNSMPEKTPQGNTGIVNITYRGKLPAKAHDAHMVN